MSPLAATSALSIEALSVAAATDRLLDPGAPEWGKVAPTAVGLEPTPLDSLPSSYVRAAWAGRPRGNVRTIEVRGLVAREALCLNLRWAAARPVSAVSDWTSFPDACAALFPADGVDAPLATMGSRRRPVAGWYWRAGAAAPCAFRARGLGTVERAPSDPLQAQARHEEGNWSVVLVRPLDAGVPFGPGATVPIGFAVWCGSARERAGLKSHTPSWQELRLW